MKQLLSFLTLVLLSFTGFTQNITLDSSFDPGVGPDGSVLAVAVQNDEKVYIGGLFNKFNGGSNLSLRAVRLNSNGTLDASFSTASSGVLGTVYSILIQNDGKILFVGPQRNAWPANNVGVIRLNQNGSLDSTFNMQGAGFNNTVLHGVLQPDGKLIVCGTFTQFNGSTQNRIARLNSNGTIDTSFNIGTGFNLEARTLALQSDGKILVGGLFKSFNGTTRNHIARLNADGSIDTTFDPGNTFTDDIRKIAIQADGKIIVGGNLKENFPIGVIRPRIARLNSNGTLDSSFNPGNGFNQQPNAFHIQTDGKIIVSGDFTTYNTDTIKGICRLNTDGGLDTTFNPGSGFQAVSNPGLSFVNAMAVQTNGKIVTAGNFDSYNNTGRVRVARLIGLPVQVSINENKENQTIVFYPNPANDFLNIEGIPQNSHINIIDFTGKVLFGSTIPNNFERIDVSTLKNGIYFIQVINNGNIIAVDKIIIRR
jgi:uncharacterized delta-60 repeat protein